MIPSKRSRCAVPAVAQVDMYRSVRPQDREAKVRMAQEPLHPGGAHRRGRRPPYYQRGRGASSSGEDHD
ncbi:hypothetical protein Pmani_038127 [Petrolisthes manimaculis]|uniref:Uncharacterized protein n=1 Tax=Petrolisthes manimaculis TaxID=1843537 RepID=A0AAE1TMM2_9EUCA|nr:hypothetical protein Pmani_038127 [Petrolisthes manimaculis]